MWYIYRQNNSGGKFRLNAQIGHSVFIEAESAKMAEAKAQSIGTYFDGCADGVDCRCCGDRWKESRSHTAEEVVDDINDYAKSDTIRGDGTYLGERHTLHLYFEDGRHITKYGRLVPIKDINELKT